MWDEARNIAQGQTVELQVVNSVPQKLTSTTCSGSVEVVRAEIMTCSHARRISLA